jgi:hypothetical protein
MVYLYTCDACLSDNHEHCERTQPAPKGQFGGRHCRCVCNGDPLWNDPQRIHKQLQRDLRRAMSFEEASMKSKSGSMKIG